MTLEGLMMRALSAFGLVLCLVVSLTAPSDVRAGEAAGMTRDILESGNLTAGDRTLAAYVTEHPNDNEARFGLGLVRFALAIERLGQTQYRYGLHPPRYIGMPVLRFPVPDNPSPEALTYDQQRKNLQQFLNDLRVVDETLAPMRADDVKIPLNIGAIAFDLTASGDPTKKATLADIVATVMASGRPSIPTGTEDRLRLDIAFDRADALWLRGYVHLLSATLEFALAYDWHETFEELGGIFYTRIDPPPPIDRPAIAPEAQRRTFFGDNVSIADAVALLHEIRWPLAEPERLKASHAHLKQVIALSRETWKAIATEADDDREWLPGAHQKNAVLPMPMSDEQVAGWLAVLDEFDAVLDGKKLVPHWRFQKGFNLRNVFFKPQRFDLVLWMTGHDAAKYVEDGPTITWETWNSWQRIFGGNFIGYAFWIN
jgi:hypothetical protein